MAGATEQQYGVKNWRIYREPIDGESVHLSYQDIIDRLEPNEVGDGTKLGTFYGGLITSVTSDSNNAYNGPWYISYNIAYNNRVSYLAERIPVRSEIDYELYSVLAKPKYTKPKMTVQFLSATNGIDFTTVSKTKEIYEDIEIMSYFTPAIKINWPTRTSDNENGTRAYDAVCNPSKPNELLGYSYGVDSNGISFDCLGVHKTAYDIDNVISFPTTQVTTEGEYIVFDNIQISYLPASYMYYPQFYDRGRFEFSYGEGNTCWFGKGVYIPDTIKYVVNGKYRYYWGFSDTLPMNKSDLQKGNSGLLNNTSFLNGTTTSCIVGDGYDKPYFWVAFPSMYGITEYNDSFKVLLEQVDGLMFDLISHNQNMSLKHMSVNLGDSDIIDQYNVAFFKFENPIGNKSSIVSFRILPKEAINYVYNISNELDKEIELEGDSTDILRTETSNNIIYEEEVFE